MKPIYAFCTSCKTNRLKITEEYDEFDSLRFWTYQCQCGIGGGSNFKPKELIDYEEAQARERDYHDGLEGVV